MQKSLGEVLAAEREQIAAAWAERVKQSSEMYRRRPIEEIEAGTLRLVDGLVEAVTLGSYERIRDSLVDIAQSRRAMGFAASDVQRAILLGCDAIFPTLQTAFGNDAQQLVWSVTQIEKTVHRGLGLLSQVFHEVQVREAVTEAEEARALLCAAERRLQAVLGALNHGAIAVNAHLVVLWADSRACSPRCGALAPGEAYECRQSGDPGGLLAAAWRTGEVQRAEPTGECDVWLAVPVRAATGEIVEVIGLMGA